MCDYVLLVFEVMNIDMQKESVFQNRQKYI